MTTTEKIEEHIQGAPPKEILFTEDFKAYGGAEAIKSALHRLVKKGELQRLAKGIYVKPGYSALLSQETTPAIEDIAHAITRRDRASILPSGAMAMYKLGLTTQLPLKLTYLTDGSARTINLGEATLTFKRTTPKKLAYKGNISALTVQALGEIGKNAITQDQIKLILEKLRQEKYEYLKHDIRLAPQWIGEIMAKALQ